jgi:hypothetical protein
MKSTGLMRRFAALGAGVAMAATMVTGLFAAPAAATTGTVAGGAAAAKGSPIVSATRPWVSEDDYAGECPVTVTFTSKIRVKLRGGHDHRGLPLAAR